MNVQVPRYILDIAYTLGRCTCLYLRWYNSKLEQIQVPEVLVEILGG